MLVISVCLRNNPPLNFLTLLLAFDFFFPCQFFLTLWEGQFPLSTSGSMSRGARLLFIHYSSPNAPSSSLKTSDLFPIPEGPREHLKPRICSDNVVLLLRPRAREVTVRRWLVSVLVHPNKFLPPSRGSNYRHADSSACGTRFKTPLLALQGTTAAQLRKQRGGAGRSMSSYNGATLMAPARDLSAKKLRK